MGPHGPRRGGSQQPSNPDPRDLANPTSQVSVSQGHDQPGSETKVDHTAGTRNGVVNGKTVNATHDSDNISRAPSGQEGSLVDPALTSGIPARPNHDPENPSLLSSPCAGGPRHNPGTAGSSQNSSFLSMSINELRTRGMALYERMNSGEKLTAAESEELKMIKEAVQRAKDQFKKTQTAQDSSPYVGHLQQANSLVSSAPPQHTQNPQISIDEIRMRFVQLQEKQKSHGLTALEFQDFRALGECLRRQYSGHQQGNLQAAGNNAVPSPSRAPSSQHQSTVVSPSVESMLEVSEHRPCTPQHVFESQQDPRHRPDLLRSHSSANDFGNGAEAQFQSPSIVQEPFALSNMRTAGQASGAQNSDVRYNSIQGYNTNQTAGLPAQQSQSAAPQTQQYQGPVRRQPYNVQGQFAPSQPQLQNMSYQGPLPPRTQAMVQMPAFQAGIMPPPPQNPSLRQDVSRHPSASPSCHVTGAGYQQLMTCGPSPMTSLAGQKHSLYGHNGNEGTQDRNEVQNPAKRARLDAPLEAKLSVGQVQASLKQTQNPASDTTRVQEQPTITLPLGNLDPETAQEVLGKAIKIMQNGSTLTPTPPGMKAFILPPRSFIAFRTPGSSLISMGFSDTIDTHNWKIAAPSFRRGLEAGKQHELKMQAGVPDENIRVAVFDDRQSKLEPVSKPVQSSPINAEHEGRTDDTKIGRDQGAIAGNEDTQVKSSTSEVAAITVTAQTQSPGATAGLKRPLSAVQEGVSPVENSNHRAKRAATATPKNDSLAADDCHKAELAKVSPKESTAVLPSSDERAPVPSPEGQPSRPWVPTREEAKEADLGESIPGRPVFLQAVLTPKSTQMRISTER